MHNESNLDQMIEVLSSERSQIKDKASEIIQNFELGRIQKYLDICALMNDLKRKRKLKAKGYSRGYYKLTQASAEEFGEPLPWLELEKKLDLSHQYDQQLDSLRSAGLIEVMPEIGGYGIYDITGAAQPMPILAEIVQGIDKIKGELLLQKVSQGFENFLIVPFGLSIKKMIEGYKKTLTSKIYERRFYDANGESLSLSISEPINIVDPKLIGSDEDQEDQIVYFNEPRQGFRTGRTKAQLLNKGHAFEIKLVEDLPQLPTDASARVVGDRLQIASDRSISSVLQILEDVHHNGENLFNFEDWLSYAITKLNREGVQIDTFAWGHPDAVRCCNAGSEILGSRQSVFSYFYTTSNQVVIDLSGEKSAQGDVGVRVFVPIK